MSTRRKREKILSIILLIPALIALALLVAVSIYLSGKFAAELLSVQDPEQGRLWGERLAAGIVLASVVIAAYRRLHGEKDKRTLLLLTAIVLTTVFGVVGGMMKYTEQNARQSEEVLSLDRQIAIEEDNLRHFQVTRQPGNLRKTREVLAQLREDRQVLIAKGSGAGNALDIAISELLAEILGIELSFRALAFFRFLILGLVIDPVILKLIGIIIQLGFRKQSAGRRESKIEPEETAVVNGTPYQARGFIDTDPEVIEKIITIEKPASDHLQPGFNPHLQERYRQRLEVVRKVLAEYPEMSAVEQARITKIPLSTFRRLRRVVQQA